MKLSLNKTLDLFMSSLIFKNELKINTIINMLKNVKGIIKNYDK